MLVRRFDFHRSGDEDSGEQKRTIMAVIALFSVLVGQAHMTKKCRGHNYLFNVYCKLWLFKLINGQGI